MMLIFTFCLTALAADPRQVEPEEIDRSLHGVVIRVEDQVSGVIGAGDVRQFRLRRSPSVIFRIGAKGPRDLEGNVAVIGKVTAEPNSLSVVVQSVELLPSDVNQYERRSLTTDPDDFESWYRLSDWAQQRNELYGDAVMSERSRSAFERAVQIERRLARNDLPRLSALRDRLEKAPLREIIDRAELDHALLRAESESRAGESPEELEAFAQRIARTLRPGDDGYPTPLDEQVSSEYDASPVKVFASADAPRRRQLARHWEIELLQRSGQGRIDHGDWPAEQAADWAAMKIPDNRAIERAWINESIDRDLARADEFRSADVEKLAFRIRDRLGDAERADQLLRDWLTNREKELRDKESTAQREAIASGRTSAPKDARARFDLAESWLRWFRAEPASSTHAAQLLVEALEAEPAFDAASEKLHDLGYRKTPSNRWLSPAQAKLETTEIIRPTTVAVGMSEEEVEQILGSPDKVATVITGPYVVERQWIYRGVDRTSVTVFEKDRGGHWRVRDLTGSADRPAPDQVE